MSETNDTSPVLAYEANCSIKREIGRDFRVADAITEVHIDSCARLIRRATDDFFSDALGDLEQLEKLTATSSGIADAEPLRLHTHNIRSLARVLGFTLIAETCVHFSLTLEHPTLSVDKKQALLHKLVGALRLAFDQRIENEGGDAGQAILDILKNAQTLRIKA